MRQSYALNVGLETNDGTPAITLNQIADVILPRIRQSDPEATLHFHRVVTSDTEDTAIVTLTTSAGVQAVAAILSVAATHLHQSAIAALHGQENAGYLFGEQAANWGGCDFWRAGSINDMKRGFDITRFILP